MSWAGEEIDPVRHVQQASFTVGLNATDLGGEAGTSSTSREQAFKRKKDLCQERYSGEFVTSQQSLI